MCASSMARDVSSAQVALPAVGRHYRSSPRKGLTGFRLRAAGVPTFAYPEHRLLEGWRRETRKEPLSRPCLACGLSQSTC